MENLLVLKERLRILFGKRDIYIKRCIKFVLSLVTFIAINSAIGYFSALNNILVVIALALVCAFLSINFTVVISAVLILIHLASFSIEVAGIFAIVFIIMFLVYFRYSKSEGYVLLITPIAFILKIPYMVPLCLGMVGTPFSAIPVVFGVIVHYMIQFVSHNSAAISKAHSDEMIAKIEYLMQQLINNKVMLLVALAFAVSLILVYVIRRMSIDYSWEIALITGTMVNLLILLVGDFAFDIPVNIVWLIIGSIISLIGSVVFKFFIFTVDYSRVERVQFEDDEYYYYVKAVPKMYMSAPEKKIKRFAAGRNTAEEIEESDLDAVKNIDELKKSMDNKLDK